MDWTLAIHRNREALKGIIAALFAMAGLASLGMASTLPRHVYAAVMLVLRPAESAVRRLIIIAARGLVLKPRASRPVPAGVASFASASASGGTAFQLIDPLKHFSANIWNEDGPAFVYVDEFSDQAFAYHHAQSADTPIPAGHIFQRLHALSRALNDLPREARRLARWQARQDLEFENRKTNRTPYKPMRRSPFRPGLPPGYRQCQIHEVDEVLRECHRLALYSARPDTG